MTQSPCFIVGSNLAAVKWPMKRSPLGAHERFLRNRLTSEVIGLHPGVRPLSQSHPSTSELGRFLRKRSCAPNGERFIGHFTAARFNPTRKQENGVTGRRLQ